MQDLQLWRAKHQATTEAKIQELERVQKSVNGMREAKENQGIDMAVLKTKLAVYVAIAGAIGTVVGSIVGALVVRAIVGG